MIPRPAHEGILIHQVPMDREHLPRVLVPVLYREILITAQSKTGRAARSEFCWLIVTHIHKPDTVNERKMGSPTANVASHSLIDPSPFAVTSWFSLTSLQVMSKRPSCVSYLHQTTYCIVFFDELDDRIERHMARE
ncbi:hypothetical protein BC938DRAFT_473239 [Jimgerdemannia flammicorona]|uniref:Uncharacterized protein n=1 Tax=Jimgerdemannia flammicorona TaxID=994334 RepID=A0A433Q4G8_9FUNG|nr:hypothetical protein BC938DRAFT_473239 [Jimgerdemannia flammicorona]